jgi:methyl-accepting chemotaxis protein
MKSRRSDLSVRIVVPMFGVLVASVALLLVYIWWSTSRQTVDASIMSAGATVQQFKTLRAYYTENVVNKVKQSGAMKISSAHAGSADTIPLPATMIHDLSEALGRGTSGTGIRLYSAHPFPNRATRVLDSFAEDALAELRRNPDATFVRSDTIDGKPVVRVAVADQMSSDACVACHNSHPDSPKKDWQRGDVRGALEVILPTERQTAAAAGMMTTIAVIAIVGLIALAAMTLWLTRRNVVNPLHRSLGELAASARQVSAASSQVSGASQSLSEGATQQAASLEETSASMEEMASMTRKNAENSQQAAVMVAESERLVQSANGALGEMVASMAAIKQSSDKVAKIIKTIDEIAFQTNILALNAAVEAARAGDAGMGFAVVADEVRALAQRSARAAQDTAALIEESIARSNEGQQKVQLVTGAIESMTASTGHVKRLVDEVTEASRQQAQGIAQVSQAIAQMETVTQGTAATAEESAAASEELNAQAKTSMQIVAEVSNLVDGGATASFAELETTPEPAAATKDSGRVLQLARRANLPPSRVA